MGINRINIESKCIVATGDIHGEFNKLVEFIKKYDLKDTCIIVCGDCGLGFSSIEGEKNNIAKLNKLAKNYNDIVLLMRGNHDNPMYFSENLINTKNVIAVPDYTVVNDSILLVGGATSIDRQYRIEKEAIKFDEYLEYHPGVDIEYFRRNKGGLYWENELPVYDEDALNELKANNISIKHVCTHTCPSFCDPVNKDGIKYWMSKDPTLEETVNKERDVMDKIWNKLKSDGHPIESWTYGHYHRHSHNIHEDVSFTMLDAIVYWYSVIDWIEIKNKN